MKNATNNAMTYKGFTARIELGDDVSIFHGRLLGIRDVVGFQAVSVSELCEAFHEAVDDYLEACATLEQEPEPVGSRSSRQGSARLSATVMQLLDNAAPNKDPLAHGLCEAMGWDRSRAV